MFSHFSYKEIRKNQISMQLDLEDLKLQKGRPNITAHNCAGKKVLAHFNWNMNECRWKGKPCQNWAFINLPNSKLNMVL